MRIIIKKLPDNAETAMIFSIDDCCAFDEKRAVILNPEGARFIADYLRTTLIKYFQYLKYLPAELSRWELGEKTVRSYEISKQIHEIQLRYQHSTDSGFVCGGSYITPFGFPHNDRFIFHFNCYSEEMDGRISFSLYDQIIPCSFSGGNNILSMQGDEALKPLVLEAAQNNTCELLTPVLFSQLLLDGVATGAAIGMLRGLEQATKMKLTKSGASEDHAYWASKGIFYGTYFLTQLTVNWYDAPVYQAATARERTELSISRYLK